MNLLSGDRIADEGEFFKVLAGSAKSQMAVTVLKPGQVSGEYGTEHPDSDQWLYVLEGEGTVLVGGKSLKLRANDLLLIKAGEEHQIKGAGQGILRTINFYAPPAY